MLRVWTFMVLVDMKTPTPHCYPNMHVLSDYGPLTPIQTLLWQMLNCRLNVLPWLNAYFDTHSEWSEEQDHWLLESFAQWRYL